MTPRMNISIWRWVRFNIVGAVGIAVQFAVLWMLTSMAQLNYLLATVLAVEAAVIHNFFWHERFTWPDRVHRSLPESARRLWQFNLANGLVSLAGNLLLMRLLVGQLQLPLLSANAMSIVACSLVNFVASDRWVFAD